MKWKDIKIPKTITGIAVVLLGAGINFVPAVGPLASPYIMGAGAAMIGVGGVDKMIRASQGKDPLENEKTLIKKITKK